MLYEVQVGAFAQRKQAAAVLAQVQDWFPKAYIAPRKKPAGAYYRVRVGPFTHKEEAQKLANTLKRGGHRVFLDEVPERLRLPKPLSPPMAPNDLRPGTVDGVRRYQPKQREAANSLLLSVRARLGLQAARVLTPPPEVCDRQGVFYGVAWPT